MKLAELQEITMRIDAAYGESIDGLEMEQATALRVARQALIEAIGWASLREFQVKRG